MSTLHRHELAAARSSFPQTASSLPAPCWRNDLPVHSAEAVFPRFDERTRGCPTNAFPIPPSFACGPRSCAVVPAGMNRDSLYLRRLQRCQTLPSCTWRDRLMYAGSQVLDANQVERTSAPSLTCPRAADTLASRQPISTSGGSASYAGWQESIWLASATSWPVWWLARRRGIVRTRRACRAAGWYLTRSSYQRFGRPTVIVDGGVHQRADMWASFAKESAPPLS